MLIPRTYDPPRIVFFGGQPGNALPGIGFACGTGPQATSNSCTGGWTAQYACYPGCTASDIGSCVTGSYPNGCSNGYSAQGSSCGGGTSPACTSGTSGPYSGSCMLTVCCSGSGGSSTWSTCSTGDFHIGACKTGNWACGESCLTKDACNPPVS